MICVLVRSAWIKVRLLSVGCNLSSVTTTEEPMLPEPVTRLLDMVQKGHQTEQAYATYLLVSVLRDAEQSGTPLRHPSFDKLNDMLPQQLVPWTPPTTPPETKESKCPKCGHTF
jgi:hypothetical protein